ncbi:universal stress protein [Streptacidiphilus rugosus]|uniref:universal stress protein n=1 Tax=Streptacidiphilus rugosus TaxID=405783 RepID=UPI0005678E84|nr:universal stress protein [Streptacidiphilus rugosus]
MSRRSSGAVVVGLDPSADSRAALVWAADEAERRGATLRIGHSWNLEAYRLPRADLAEIAEPARNAAWTLLEQAADQARQRHPGLPVEPELIEEPPVEGLLRMAATDADVVVTGRRGLHGFRTFLLGSVSRGVVAHAPVPAVVVSHGGTPRTHGPVVLGVAPESDTPVDFAFGQAEMRGVPLVAVRAWTRPQPATGHRFLLPRDAEQRTKEEAADLDRLLAPARAAHPGVAVITRVVAAVPEQAIVESAQDACLVVVGAHRRLTRFGLPIGRVPQRVMHAAPCPVAVVPQPRR